jgi:hypothetical protein
MGLQSRATGTMIRSNLSSLTSTCNSHCGKPLVAGLERQTTQGTFNSLTLTSDYDVDPSPIFEANDPYFHPLTGTLCSAFGETLPLAQRVWWEILTLGTTTGISQAHLPHGSIEAEQ